MLAVKIILILLIVLVALFLLSLVIYFFNLDMKLAAMLTPVMMKYYDWQRNKRERNKKRR